jgi:hypothetical protein
MIQSVKDKVIGSWWSAGHTIPSDTKAQALVAIDQESSRLPVDHLPRTELVAIAEGIRDRIYRPVIQAQQRAREEEERRRQQARQPTETDRAWGRHDVETFVDEILDELRREPEEGDPEDWWDDEDEEEDEDEEGEEDEED